MEKMEVDDDAVVDLSVNSVRRENRRPPDVVHDLSRPLLAHPFLAPLPPPMASSHRDEISLGIIPRAIKDFDDRYPRRNLRPRQDRNYAESPDIIILSDEEPKTNGYTNGYDSDTDDGEMPPMPPIKELSPAEVEERERGLRKLREELRNEEMKLVLLKKLKQSQQMKENIAVVPPTPQGGVIPTPGSKSSAGSVNVVAPTAATVSLLGSKIPPPPQQPPPPLVRANHKQPLPPMLRGQLPPSRSQSLHHPPPLLLTPQAGRTSAPGLPSNILLAQQSHQRAPPGPHPGRPSINTPPGVVLGGLSTKESHHSPSAVIPQPLMGNVLESKCSGHQPFASEPPPQDRSRQMEDAQSPAQRQAAAKLALRKQLEKTLLQTGMEQDQKRARRAEYMRNFRRQQRERESAEETYKRRAAEAPWIPPPKPPPPEMHFIPNPSNTEFIYLLGLEHVVDYITKDQKPTPQPPDPFKCFQCHTDFTPVWKWERSSGKGSGKRDKEPLRISIYAGLDQVDHEGVSPGKDPKVICEQCVTSNVKKALKAEHTNRLKTAFVKALQQEQEIEQRLAQVGSGGNAGVLGPGSIGCASPPDESPSGVSSAASTPTAPTPPAPPTPKPATPTQVPRHAAATPPLPPNSSSKMGGGHHSAAAAAAAAAALHQQLLRGLPPHQPLPAHMIPFSPLLYPYQLAMAQAAGAKGMAAELQRQAADLQRQYLLDMIPSPAPSPSRAHAQHPGHPHSHAHAHAHSLNNWKT